MLVNPAAGPDGPRRSARLVELARRIGAPVEVTEGAADVTRRARRAVAEGVERLLVAGGDGTVHHAVQALAGSPCALAVVPVGTGNDFAAAAGVPADPAAAVELAASGPLRRIDLGRATVGGGAAAWFSTYCGVGFDSEAARHANQEMRFLSGRTVYLYAVLRTLVTFRPPEVEVEHDGGGSRGRVMFVTVANGPSFGGGMRIAPEARLDDGLLDLVIVREVGRLELLRVFPKVYGGRHVGHPAVEIVRTRRVTIRLAPGRELELYGDGEPMLPLAAGGVAVAVVPGALAVCGIAQTTR